MESAKALIAQVAESPEFVEHLAETAMQADLGGRAFVSLIEVPAALGEGPKVSLAFDRPDAFLRLPFQEAVDAAIRNRVTNQRAIEDALTRYRETSREVARLIAEELTATVIRQVEQASISGSADIGADLSEAVGDRVSSYLDLAYQNQVGNSYGAGRQAQMLEPSVVDALPYFELVSADDSRVRENHRLLDGSVFAKSDVSALGFMPPNGHRCRCVAVSRGPEYASRVIAGSAAPARPDPGWDTPPG